MPRLSRAQQLAWQQIVAVATAGYPPAVLGSRLFAAVEAAVPNDGQRLWTVDPSSLLLNRLVAVTEGDGPFRLRWLRNIYLNPEYNPPYFMPHELMRVGTAAVAYRERQELSLGLPSAFRDRVPADIHYRIYHDGLTPAGGVARLCLRYGRQWLGIFDVVRRERVSPLTPSDFAFLRLIGPTVARALGVSLARERAQSLGAAVAAPGASGILILTPERRVGYASPAAERWLDLLADEGREGHAPLPTAVWSAVGGLRLGSESPRPASTVLVHSADGTISVEASPGGEDGTVAVVLSRVRAPGPPPVPETWDLTPQERRVVELLLGGLGNRQLAAGLHVSENTVETHLSHVYDKLGVRGRTELIGLLFRDVYLSLFADEPSQSVLQTPH